MIITTIPDFSPAIRRISKIWLAPDTAAITLQSPDDTKSTTALDECRSQSSVRSPLLSSSCVLRLQVLGPLFRFLYALRVAKLISPRKLADLLAWKHSGFHIHDGGEKTVAAHDSAGSKHLTLNENCRKISRGG